MFSFLVSHFCMNWEEEDNELEDIMWKVENCPQMFVKLRGIIHGYVDSGKDTQYFQDCWDNLSRFEQETYAQFLTYAEEIQNRLDLSD